MWTHRLIAKILTANSSTDNYHSSHMSVLILWERVISFYLLVPMKCSHLAERGRSVMGHFGRTVAETHSVSSYPDTKGKKNKTKKTGHVSQVLIYCQH
jgi:hypothetical protein